MIQYTRDSCLTLPSQLLRLHNDTDFTNLMRLYEVNKLENTIVIYITVNYHGDDYSSLCAEMSHNKELK